MANKTPISKPSKGLKEPKPVLKADSAFSSPKWPIIEANKQDIILKLLYNLLNPIGQHRSIHVTPSKGKRSKKRKRKEKSSEKGDDDQVKYAPLPPTPEIAQHITIGFNSTVRHLQSTINPQGPTTPEHFAAIFLTQPTSYLPYMPLPVLATLASQQKPSKPPIRLIPFPSIAEATLCKALGIPRTGVIGLFEDVPGTASLIEYVREIDAVKVPWVREVKEGKWLGTKILFGDDGR